MSVNQRPLRSVRTSTTRPSNYYARPFGFRGSVSAAADLEPPVNLAPGFFPAITHFTDGLAALPKEVMPQLTLLKETEGKAYQPDQALTELVTAIDNLPVLPRQFSHISTHPFLNFSMTNSINGSANVSVIDGHAPRFVPHGHEAQEPSSSQPPANSDSLETRRILYYQLQEQLKVMTAVLDEKSFALNGANEALARQLERLERTMPYVEKEVSEEARLGSNTHWALPHMKEQRKITSAVNERPRRDVQAANNLAAAAAAVHENDIAATRSEARREAMQAKRNRNHNLDSDFDERPIAKKTAGTTKLRKPQEISATADAKSTANGTSNASHKRRRVDKPGTAERTTSSTANGKLASTRDTATLSRDAAEAGTTKKSKPLPTVAKKRNFGNSPAVASPPARGTFPIISTSAKEHSPAPNTARPGASRGRQNSAQSSVLETARNRPSSVASTIKSSATAYGNGNGNGSGLRTSTPELKNVAAVTGRTVAEARAGIKASYTNAEGEHTIEEVDVHGAIAFDAPEGSNVTRVGSPLKREETEPAPEIGGGQAPPPTQAEPSPALSSVPMAVTRSRGGSRPAKLPTPLNIDTAQAVAPPLVRSRSTRNASSAGPSVPSPTLAAPSPRRSHKKGAGAGAAATTPLMHASTPVADSKSPVWPAVEQSGQAPQTGRRLSSLSPGAPLSPAQSMEPVSPHATTGAAPGDGDGDVNMDAVPSADEEAEADLDPDADADENEPRYCICQGVSYGDMIACDNSSCVREWFHLDCVGLSRPPGTKTKWYCDECKELLKKGRNSGTSSR